MPYFSFASFNYNSKYIRHRNFLGELTDVNSDQDKSDASFYLPEGVRFGQTIRIPAANISGHFLRHQNFRIKLEHDPGPFLVPRNPVEQQTFNDMLFVVERGLSDQQNVSRLSFRAAINFGDGKTRYIRHRNFSLYLEPADSELARKDATFVVKSPFFTPPPVIVK